MKGTKEELGLKAQNFWIYPNLNQDEKLNQFSNLSPSELESATEVPFLFVSFPSAKDDTWDSR